MTGSCFRTFSSSGHRFRHYYSSSFDGDLKRDAAEAKKHRGEAKKYVNGAKKDANDAMEALSSLHDDLRCLEYEFKKLKERPVQESAPLAECAGESFGDRPVLDQLRQALSDAKCDVENAHEEADGEQGLRRRARQIGEE